jgi:broad specificity phosphatase PhoE
MNALKRRYLQALAFLLLMPALAPAQPVDVKALAETLKGGGYVIVFRHGATNRDQADTDPFNFDDVAKQRQLSEAGRQVAAQVGSAFKTLQIPIGKVSTSKFNRAVETGKLISGGEASATPDLTEGGLVVTPIENDRRAQALRDRAATPPEKGRNTLLVTHKPNILDAFGKDWFDVKEGEASVFRPTGDGKATLVARVQAAEWINAAK